MLVLGGIQKHLTAQMGGTSKNLGAGRSLPQSFVRIVRCAWGWDPGSGITHAEQDVNLESE